MKKLLLAAVVFPFAAQASSYVTGNVQFHSEDSFHGSSATSTLEAGHTFTNSLGGFTVYTEFDGIAIGKTAESRSSAPSPYVTLGGEQSFNITSNFWVAAGYQHLLNEGKTIENRPLVKIGYNFDNGISISNRTRFHMDAVGDVKTKTRFDNRISYALQGQPVAFSYNNIYMYNPNDGADSTMDHELRATWTREGVQPYFEYRRQGNGGDLQNNALVLGASLAF